MKKKLILGFGVVMLLAMSFGNFHVAYAASPLTSDNIEHFMKAMKPLQQLSRKYDLEKETKGSVDDFATKEFAPMSRSLDKIKDHKAYDEFTDIILDAGFSSVDQWANVGDRVMKSYISLRMKREMTPEQIQEIKKSMAEIENNAYLSAEMKKQFMANLQRTMAMVNDISNSDKADQEALEPYLPKLDQLFEELE